MEIIIKRLKENFRNGCFGRMELAVGIGKLLSFRILFGILFCLYMRFFDKNKLLVYW